MKKKSKSLKSYIKKFWHFVWHSNSIWSWLFNILLAFIIIKFIVYPVLGLVLSTSHPIVAVMSSSMDHKAIDGFVCGIKVSESYKARFDTWWELCGKWYEQRNITKEDFKNFKFKNGFAKGNILILKGEPPEKINVGDVIVFIKKNKRMPIIHRVVKKWKENGKWYFQTKGDWNPISSEFIGETKISYDEIVGKGIFRIPYLGYIKIWFVELINAFR